MSIDGVYSATPTSASHTSRFNGAVDEHRRSLSLRARVPDPGSDASMGPSMSIDGVSSTAISTSSDASSSFNGAVDEHRRSLSADHHGGRRWRASFNGAVDEHRRSRRGARDGRGGHGLASMGPSMSIDGVSTAWTRSSRRRRGFNGAVDEHRRSPSSLTRRSVDEAHASMGPSMSIDGVRRRA